MKKLSLAMLAIAGALISAAPALADTVNYTLTPADLTMAPGGGTVTFDGSIVASSDTYINSDSYNCQTGCTIDDTDFYGTPFELDSTNNYTYTGPLFTVTLGPDATGTYLGNFDIQFTDASTNDVIPFPDGLGGTQAYDSAPFEVTVTPEPASWLLLGTGLAGVWLLRRRFLTRIASF